MELIDQHAKSIMEGCKKRARDQGLTFQDETLEYIVTNRDMIELSPKMMIPTLYDYWVQDVRVISGKGVYELYPGNPYETVINTRPAISFYNDNNPDWLNVMIFYHVLAHIDFFQNNLFFTHTWDYDFEGRALSDKRIISRLRAEKGRWVDYTIEFARGVDNLVAYHREIKDLTMPVDHRMFSKTDYYFDIFLQREKQVSANQYLKEIKRYNELESTDTTCVEEQFFSDVYTRYPEFEELFKKFRTKSEKIRPDIIEYILRHSPFLKREANRWMKSVIRIVRETSLFFEPQIRTRIMNEGWASYWHETLFRQDERIEGHETDFARVNAAVTAMPKVGLNPYALGMRLFHHIEKMADRGCYSLDYLLLKDEVKKREYSRNTGKGREIIFDVRENLCDYMFIKRYIDQEFVNRHNLFVSGTRLNRARMTREYYVRSRRAEDYREMLINTLYHPPAIYVETEKTENGVLYLVHKFEGKPLKKDFIENTMIGISFLWGGPVKLETHEIVRMQPGDSGDDPNILHPFLSSDRMPAEKKPEWRKILYVMENRKLHKQEI